MFFYFSTIKNYILKLTRRIQLKNDAFSALQTENEAQTEIKILKSRINGFEKINFSMACEIDRLRNLHLSGNN